MTTMSEGAQMSNSLSDPAYLRAMEVGRQAGDESMRTAHRKRWNHADYLAAAEARDADLGEPSIADG